MKSKLLKNMCLAATVASSTFVMSTALAGECSVEGIHGDYVDGVCVMNTYAINKDLKTMADQYGDFCNVLGYMNYGFNSGEPLPPSIGQLPPALGQIFDANVQGTDLTDFASSACSEQWAALQVPST